MSKYQGAIDSISKLKIMLGGLAELGDALGSLDSLENHVDELTHKRDSLIRDVTKAQEMLAFESEKYQKVQAQIEEQLADAEKQAQEHISQAHAQAQSIKLQAQIEVDNLKKVIKASEEEHQLKLTSKSNVLADLDKQIEAQQARLDSINKELERIKSL